MLLISVEILFSNMMFFVVRFGWLVRVFLILLNCVLLCVLVVVRLVFSWLNMVLNLFYLVMIWVMGFEVSGGSVVSLLIIICILCLNVLSRVLFGVVLDGLVRINLRLWVVLLSWSVLSDLVIDLIECISWCVFK